MNLAKFTFIWGLLAWAALARAATSNADPVSEALPYIQRANSEWSHAMKSGDADAIAAPYALNALFITAAGDGIRGRAAIRDFYRARLSGKAPVVSATIERRGTAAGDGDLVFEWGWGTVARRSAGGMLQTLGGAYLTVWKRQSDGRWEIIRNVVL